MVNVSKLVSKTTFLVWPPKKLPPKKLLLKKWKAVPKEYHEIVSAIAPSSDGPFIAGGAPLAWYQNKLLNGQDIDVFCASAAQSTNIVKWLTTKSYGYQITYNSENATTLTAIEDPLLIVQVIKKDFYKSVQEVIDNFDITVAQVATDGNKFFLGEHTALHIRKKELHFNLPYRDSALGRYAKYMTYGYMPSPNTINDIVDALDINKLKAQHEYESI